MGIRSTTSFTKQNASFRFGQAIRELSLAICIFKAPISSSCCSLAFVSTLASYSHFLIPIRHHISLTCKSVLTQGLAMYAITDEGVRMVSSKYFCRATLQEILFRAPKHSHLPPMTSQCRILSSSSLSPSPAPSIVPAWLACRARPSGVLSWNFWPSPFPYSH